MSEFNLLGKMLLFFGVVLIILGGIFLLVGKLPFSGRLPGDGYNNSKKKFCLLLPLRLMYFNKYYFNYHFPNF